MSAKCFCAIFLSQKAGHLTGDSKAPCQEFWIIIYEQVQLLVMLPMLVMRNNTSNKKKLFQRKDKGNFHTSIINC